MRAQRLIHYGQRADITATLTGVDISSYVETVDKFTDVGSGEIVSARVMLESDYGDFVIRDNGGDTPIIQPYDLFRLDMLDEDGSVIFWRWLIQDDTLPQKNENGRFLVLELFARERFLQKKFFPGHFHFISFRDMVRSIIMFWNVNRGPGQPFIVTAAGAGDADNPSLDDFPPHTYGTFDFGDSTTVYDALMEVVRRLALPVAAGGAGRRYGLYFSDPASNSDSAMRLHIQANGSTPQDPQTLGDTNPPIHVSEVKSPEEGNTVIVRGQPGTGSFPKEPAMWRSLIEEFESLPAWNSTIDYDIGAYVRYRDGIWQATSLVPANTTPAPGLFWTLRSFRDYVREQTGMSDFQYSPWTNNRAFAIRTLAGNPDGSFASSTSGDVYDSLCFPDSNLVIRDSISTEGAWRDWVDFYVASVSDIPTEYLYAGTGTAQSRTYFGMRVLVKGTSWQGNTHDKLNQPYANALIMQDQDGDWIVFRVPEYNDECAVKSEGRVYRWNPPLIGPANRRMANLSSTTNLGWRDMAPTINGNDCFHYPAEQRNVPGLVGKAQDSLISDADIAHFRANSAIQTRYSYGHDEVTAAVTDKVQTTRAEDLIDFRGAFNALVQPITSLWTDDTGNTMVTDDEQELNRLWAVDSYNYGWWTTLFEAPFPKSSHHGNAVGALYGGTVDRKVPVLDLYNLNHTPSGQTGYSQDDSDNLGPIDGLKMLFHFEAINETFNWGDIPIRCVIYDLLGGVWVADKPIRFFRETAELDFAISDFSVYRARRPIFRSVSSGIARIINPELKITEIFNRRLIKSIHLHTLIGYTDDGTWDLYSLTGLLQTIRTIGPLETIYQGTVDAFHFTKTPVAIARTPNASRTLEVPIRDYPNVSNVIQLQKIATAELDLAQSMSDIWNITYDGFVNVRAGDTVYIKDADFISEDDSGEDNTLEMVVSKVTYSVGDRSAASGRRTDIEVFRRIIV